LIDDMMREVVKSDAMSDLVTNYVHAYNISVVFVFQNYFARGRHGNNLVRNCQYKVLFRNRSENLEMRTISTHLVDAPRFLNFNFQFLDRHYPGKRGKYLIIDAHPASNMSEMWCRTHIFPQEKGGEIKPLIFFVNPNFGK